MIRTILLAVVLLPAVVALENPGKIAQVAKDKYRADLTAATVAWLMKLDTAEVPEPKISADPTRSEEKKVQDIQMLNQLLRTLKIRKDQLRGTPEEKKEAEAGLYDWIRDMEPTNEALTLLVKYKG